MAQATQATVPTGEWGHGLFGCFGNIKVCLFSWFLPCVQHGWNSERVDDWGCCLCGFGCLWLYLNYSGSYFVPVGLVRQKYRQKKGIEGSLLKDLCLAGVCTMCVIAQVGIELADDEAAAAAAAAGVVAPVAADAAATAPVAMDRE